MHATTNAGQISWGARMTTALLAGLLISVMLITHATLPARAASPTLIGSWGDDCTSITINSAGQPADAQVYVRWYAAANSATAGIDGEAYAPVNTNWSQTVDPQRVRGFSYRLVDADGNYLTPLKDSAASCNIVLTPWVTSTAQDCDTILLAGGNAGTYFQASIRLRDSDGAWLDGDSADGLPQIASPGSNNAYQSVFSGTVDLPSGTYQPVIGFWYKGAWYPKSTGLPITVDTSTCQLPTPVPTPDPVVEPTPDPVVEPSPVPTADPMVEPTPDPVVEPTADPVVEPTADPVVEPTADPVVEPSPAPVQTEAAAASGEPSATPVTSASPSAPSSPSVDQGAGAVKGHQPKGQSLPSTGSPVSGSAILAGLAMIALGGVGISLARRRG